MEEAYLDIETPQGSRRQKLGDKPVTIGRHRDNLLVISDDKASRFHCVIEKTMEGFRVRDLKSKNGTLLNDQKVEEAALSDGDEIRVGHTVFRYAAAGNGGQTAARAAREAAAEEPMVSMEAPLRPQRPAPAPAAAPAKPAGAKPARRAAAAGDKRPRRDDHDSLAPIPLEGVEAAPAAAAVPMEALAAVEAEAGEADQASIEQLRQFTEQTATDDAPAEDDVALISNRGQVIHSGGAPKAAKPARGKPDTDPTTQEGIRVLRLLILACINSRATDVHVEPKASGESLVRLRVDGQMIDAMKLDKPTAARLTGVVKVLSDIDIAQRNTIQEGHFSAKANAGPASGGERRIDYRVSFTPAMHGQKLVVRVLDLANAPKHTTDLAMPEWMLVQVRKVARQDAGMVLVSGPTGSGKTTTLYSILRDIDTQTRNVITIEDPVEYQIPGVTQIPVDEHKGNNFANLLRSILRQDPDVILLGEVRDKETAQTAMQAAMTGHLVLSTVHAKDSFGTIFRLLDLGVEPYLVAQGLNLVVAQRLVRLLCLHCKEEKRPTPQQVMRMGRSIEGVSKVYLPLGCPKCLGTGYMGRRAVFELLAVTDDLRDVILKNPTMQAIKDAVRMTMFATLQQNGYRLVAEGLTSMDEIERVTGSD